jgi:hypothetical protein
MFGVFQAVPRMMPGVSAVPKAPVPVFHAASLKPTSNQLSCGVSVVYFQSNLPCRASG